MDKKPLALAGGFFVELTSRARCDLTSMGRNA